MSTPEEAEEAAKVEKVREIANVSSKTDVASRLALLDAAGFQATVEDITEWAKVKNKHTIIKGDGVDINKSRARLDIRNRVRVRLGYPEVGETGQPIFSFENDEGTTSVDVFGSW